MEHLQQQLEQLREERDAYHMAHDLAVRQQGGQDEELQLLRQRCQSQECELSALKDRQEQLAQLTDESERQLALIRDLFVQVSTARAQPEA